MVIRVAINGFGRIGRMAYRELRKLKGIKVVAINDLTDSKTLAYLLKHDSVHGNLDVAVKATQNTLQVGKETIRIFSQKDPSTLPWKELKIDTVLESSGFFRTKELAMKHIEAGTKRVLISANYKGDQKIKTLIRGVNHKSYNKKTDLVVSKGSCTTTCTSPIAQVLEENFGIQKAFLTTIHAVTSSQRIVDAPHKILREGRSLLNNMIPTETGAAVAVTRVIPKLKGKIDGMAVRVPTQAGSLVDFTAVLKKSVTAEQVNAAFKKASKGYLKGVLQYSEEELVSSDIVGNSHATIFDSKLTKANGKLVKVLAWYDNEAGYAHKIAEMIKFMGN